MVIKITLWKNIHFLIIENIKNKISNKICPAVALVEEVGTKTFYLYTFIKRSST